MKKILVIFLLSLGFLSEMQAQVPWSVSGTKTRFTKGLGIPVGDTMPGGIADTAQLLIRPQDGRLYVKYKTGWQLAIGDFVPYTGATTNVVIGDYRVSARTFLNDSILARTSAGAKLLSNSGSTVAEYGVGGGDNMDFHGFAGYNANRSSSYTARSFTDKNYADSSAALRLRISDTAAMLANRLKISDTSQILDKTVRTFGNQTGITGNKTFTNNIVANSFATASGTVSQLLVANGSVLDNTNIHTGAPTFDTTGRTLTIPTVSGGSYSVVIPRGTSSGAEGITAITTSRIGNLLTVSGDNGSNSTISIRDADSASTMRYSDTASMLSPYRRTSTLIQQSEVNGLSTSLAAKVNVSDSATMLSNYRRTTTKITNSDLANSTISGISLGSNLASLTAGYGLSGTAYSGSTGYTWLVDTSVISTKANVTGLLVGYATVGSVTAKLNISDTAAVLSNLLRKTDTATMLLPFMQYSDTAFMLSPYARTSNLPDFSAKVNVSDTAAMLSNYRRTTTKITNSDLADSAITINGSSTSLGGSISVGSVTSVGLSAPTGFNVSGSPVTSSGTLALGFTAGYSLPTTDSQALWDIAYNKRVVSAGLSSSQLTLTLGDASTVTVSVPTFNQNTTGTAASLSAVLSSTLGGAGSVSGILKANGSGVVSAAVAGTDYVVPSALSGYLPLTGGTLSGSIFINSTLSNSVQNGSYIQFGSIASSTYWVQQMNTSNNFDFWYYGGSWAKKQTFNTDGGMTLTGALSGTSLSMSGDISGGRVFSEQANAIVQAYDAGGTSATLRAYSGANYWDWAVKNNSNLVFDYNGTTKVTIENTGAMTLSGSLSGTSLSMSGDGRFGTSTALSGIAGGIVTNSATSSGMTMRVGDVNKGYVYVSGSDVAVEGAASMNVKLLTSSGYFYNISPAGVATSNATTTLLAGATDDGTNKLIVNGGVKGTAFQVGNGQYYKATRNSGALVTDMIGIPSGTDNVRILTTGDFNVVNGSLITLLGIANTGAITASSSVQATTFQATTGFNLRSVGVNRGGIYGLATWTSVGSDYSPTFAAETGLGLYFYVDGTATKGFNVSTSGAITASSSVTANSFVKSGGTSSQFLKADGSVDGNTYVNTSSTQSVGGNKTFTSSTVFTGVRFAYSSVSSNYTLTDNDDYVVVTNASTITLPTAVGRAGKRYVLRSTAGSGVSSSLTSTSGQTVDGIIGPFSFGFGNYNILIVFSDGANWFSETFITGG